MEKDYKKYASIMKALSDETRIKIFDMVLKEELCACRLLEEFSITQPTLSYHMKILSDSGLVKARKDGVWMRYSASEEGLESIRKFFSEGSCE
ncbi:MAG: transcriptional regulator, ArsR family [Firmicutes bacterium]|nr:transcriptional regulator, ArsR family [Bacillota bacterium]